MINWGTHLSKDVLFKLWFAIVTHTCCSMSSMQVTAATSSRTIKTRQSSTVMLTVKFSALLERSTTHTLRINNHVHQSTIMWTRSLKKTKCTRVKLRGLWIKLLIWMLQIKPNRLPFIVRSGRLTHCMRTFSWTPWRSKWVASKWRNQGDLTDKEDGPANCLIWIFSARRMGILFISLYWVINSTLPLECSS